ncbi:hypothetical protein [Mucilaginibacter pineti]|uniref:hypothetical protein n=1 Tax=Mucilaginibacter pineti TaxID=1391627 RepID=UPI00115FC34F|nr:hypothetical protein [Mucilaginibacter pineti]
MIPLYRYNLAPGKGLVTPLDLGYAAKAELLSHIGRYVTVSGTAADIRLVADPLLVKLSDRHGEPLLTAVINGRARDKAIMVYH